MKDLFSVLDGRKLLHFAGLDLWALVGAFFGSGWPGLGGCHFSSQGHWFYLGESGGHQPQNFIDRTNDWSTPSRILGVAG